jgi:hypothetical protein
MPRAARTLSEIVAEKAPKPRAVNPARRARNFQSPSAAAGAAGVSDIEAAYRALALVEKAAGDLRSVLATLQTRPLPPEQPDTPGSSPRVGYRLGEAARMLGVSPRILSREIRSGALPARVSGKIIIISHDALCAFARGSDAQA